MSPTRIIATFCAVTFAAAAAWTAADDTNSPIWQEASSSNTGTSQATTSRPQFFSPNTPGATETKDNAAEGEPKKRMRLVEPEARPQTAESLTMDHPQWPSSPQDVRQDPVAVPLISRGRTQSSSPSAVTDAGFETSNSTSSDGVVPAGMTAQPDQAASDDPFGEFLRQENRSSNAGELPSLPPLGEPTEYIPVAEEAAAESAASVVFPQVEPQPVPTATPASSQVANPFPLRQTPVEFQPAFRSVPTQTANFSNSAPRRDTVMRSASYAESASGSQPRTAVNGPTTAQIRLSWKAVDDLNVGQECLCELIVQNEGNSDVQQVVVEARLPDNVRLVAASPEPTSSNGNLAWTFDSLRASEQQAIQLEVIPLERGDIRAEAFVRFSGYSGSTLTVHEPKIDVEVTGPERVAVGEQVGYVVHVSNPGTGTAKNVVIQAAIPEGLEHRSGNRLVIEVGTLAAGEARQARLTLTAVKGGRHQIAVRTNSDTGLTAEAVADLSIAAPQLEVTMDTADVRTVGEVGDLRLTIANNGQVASANARAKYRLPEGFEFVKADGGGRFSQTTRTVEWFVGTIAPRQETHFTVQFRPTAAGVTTHQAGIISELGEVTMANLDVSVQGVARLEVASQVAATAIQAGQENTYEIQVSSTGSRAATNVGVSCELPAGAKFVAAAGPSEYIAENGVIVFRSMPELEAGQSVVYSIRVRCERAGPQRLRTRVASESVSEPVIDEATINVRQ